MVSLLDSRSFEGARNIGYGNTYEENVFTHRVNVALHIPGYDYHKQSLGELVVRLASHFPQKYIIRNEIYISK